MVKEVQCKDAGFEDCDFVIRDENEDEMVDLVQQHAERTHDKSVSRDDVQGLMNEV
ncbi:DUF1059 domain-containing protein [Natronosalvus halobius]|uniref:DUF1059 domain-containing protein n=1 Tax=Natronosalvus halobius TaxID=2953746 RepID=UPI00209E49DC|nr:DUF1059 domain-containing protein [Natronosalvus halobius]USZ70977.1 DUF1059 domain-containing protein [Natronosalvus halobius]